MDRSVSAVVRCCGCSAVLAFVCAVLAVQHVRADSPQPWEQNADGEPAGPAARDAAAQEAAGKSSTPVLRSAPAAEEPPADDGSGCLEPQYDSRNDDELYDGSAPVVAGSQPAFDPAALHVLSIGPSLVQLLAGGGTMLGGELGVVPFVTKSLVWFGFLSSIARDVNNERTRYGLGLEMGTGPLALDVSALYSVNHNAANDVVYQVRGQFLIPVWYNRPEYSGACCQKGSALRSCSCAHTVWIFSLQPMIGIEVPHNWITVNVLAGVVGKISLAI